MKTTNWTPAEQKAIDANPDLPEDLAASFADTLNDMAAETGEPNFSKMLGVPDGEGFPPAKPGSMQELFPYLRDPRYV